MAAVNSVRDSKPVCVAGSSDKSLPNDRNSFYTRFEKDNHSEMADTISSLTPGDPIITIDIDTVGGLLSPLLFIMYTDDCRSLHPNRHLVKFADDTVLLSLLSGPILDHGPALTEFVEWCDSSCLELNVTKTKEMFVDFSRHQAGRTAARIHGEPVDAVHQYKYLHC
ncbi:hypothetical protein SKAU_G00067820 [Synaphobranchus kaupii]|uniref:Reverse transcriptase domain-containing protein n=1 Tax=Synaphobranchus kaupii TaxID=118154 RepID=A0A9Q1JBF5_SYNKA|nr:hypothetical protein SKAU_G00067820 [Synaphobranchus kaupii]